MRVADFEYELPEELIAQEPAPERDAARMFVHRIRADRSEHERDMLYSGGNVRSGQRRGTVE